MTGGNITKRHGRADGAAGAGVGITHNRSRTIADSIKAVNNFAISLFLSLYAVVHLRRLNTMSIV